VEYRIDLLRDGSRVDLTGSPVAAQLEQERDQPLLGAVVEVSLESSPCRVGSIDQALSRGVEVFAHPSVVYGGREQIRAVEKRLDESLVDALGPGCIRRQRAPKPVADENRAADARPGPSIAGPDGFGASNVLVAVEPHHSPFTIYLTGDAV